MGLVYTLNSFQGDVSNKNTLCFNGFLKTYLETRGHDDPHGEILKELLNKNENAYLMKDVVITINDKLIANKIIRYKDIYKIPKDAIRIPYIIYGEGKTSSYAMILTERSYLETKGLYYTATEEGGLLGIFRNDVLALTLKDSETVLALYPLLVSGKPSVRSLQREQDKRHFDSIEALVDKASSDAAVLAQEIDKRVIQNPGHRAQCIQEVIVSWFLLKKLVYVECMMDKEALSRLSSGDVKAHRNKAKELSTRVRFIPFSELWRL